MKRFTGGWGVRFGAGFMGVCGFGTFYFMVILAIQRALEWHGSHVTLLLASIPFGLLGLAFGMLCLWGILDSFTVYTLDEQRIEKRTLYGTQRMTWKDISGFRTGGKATSDIYLTDHTGRRMRIDPGLIRDPQGELRARVEEQLAGLRAKQRQQLGWEEQSYRPLRGMSWLLLPFVLSLLGFGLMPFLDPKSFTPQAWNVPFGIGIEALALLLALLWVHALTWKVTVSRGMLLSESLIQRKRIPMDRIESVMTREVSTKNGTTNQTTIKGAGQTISISDNMENYTLVRDYIRDQAGKQAMERGEAAIPELERKQSKQGAVILTVCVLLLVGMMGFVMQMARTRLAAQEALDRHGVTTTGRIDGKYTSGSKTTTYLIQYEFQLNGVTYYHSSPVTTRDYEAAQPGQPVTITYLPDRPGISRAQQSIGRREAEHLQRLSYVNLLMLAPLPLVYWIGRRKARTKAAQSLPT